MSEQLNAFQEARAQEVAGIVYDSLLDDINKSLESAQKLLEGPEQPGTKLAALLILTLSLQAAITQVSRDMERFGGLGKRA